ncbi:MAG: GNAT family N-acetyltransferase [Myxococcales bacterium]|jgi:GNAT superfamily N-acetyltransferase
MPEDARVFTPPVDATLLRFGADYREHVTLHDGSTAQLFAMNAAHAPCLMRGFERLSARSRYLRFLRGGMKLGPDVVRYLTDVDGQRHYAIAARVPGSGGGPAGVARIVQVAGSPERVEAAITVVDAYQRQGLGTALAARIVEAARERGYRAVVADALAENRPVLRLLRRGPRQPQLRRQGTAIEALLPL